MSKQARFRLAKFLLLPVATALSSMAVMAAQPAAEAVSPNSIQAPAEVSTQALAAHADVVALVTVTQVSSLINRAMSFTGLRSIEAYSYQLDIHRLWKGDASAEAVLNVRVQQCSKPLIKGERYLIFGERETTVFSPGNTISSIEKAGHSSLTPVARDGSAPEWLLRSCEQAIPASQAEAYRVQLNQLYLSPVAQRIP